jgi:8-oxo-dGTP diphosphatase
MPEHLMADIPQKAFIAHEGRILLTHDVDGTWQPPGGRLNVGEQPEEGLRREMREELGIEVALKDILHTFCFTSKSGLAHYVVVYLADLIGSVSDLKPDLNEMTEIRWMGQDDFEDLKMRDGYKEALRKYFHARTP